MEELTRTLFAQIDSLKSVGPGEIYIEKVKEIRKRQREAALKENSFWVNSLQWADIHQVDPRLLVRYAAMVDSLDARAVQTAAQQYFDMDNYVRWCYTAQRYKCGFSLEGNASFVPVFSIYPEKVAQGAGD